MSIDKQEIACQKNLSHPTADAIAGIGNNYLRHAKIMKKELIGRHKVLQ